MDLATMRDGFRRVLGLPELDDSLVKSYLNAEYRYNLPVTLLPTELYDNFTITTESGTGEYGLDPDMVSVIQPVMVDNVVVPVFFDREWFFKRYASRYTEEYGQPKVVLMFGNMLWMAPVPDGEYTIKTTCLARPVDLKYDDDRPFDTAWAFPIVYGAAATFAFERGDIETFQTAQP